MQPMPQSICAIVCVYVCFRPPGRLRPGVQDEADIDYDEDRRYFIW